MAANDPADAEPISPPCEELSSSIRREMAAAVDHSLESEIAHSSDWRAIGECAELLSRFWPAQGESAEYKTADLQPTGGAPDSSVNRSARSGACPGDDRLPQRFGRFEIRRALGRGGFGVVFLVFDPRLNREAALKIPRPESIVSRALRERFLREAQAAAVLDHPNIMPIYEIGEIGPLGYILTAYCKGPTLAAWLHEQQIPVALRRAAEIMVQLAEAVQHAHSRGILHRDIKPSNVLLEPATEPCADALPFAPRLSDFGLAKRLDAPTDDTRAGMILGTPQYMAPEQAAGDYREIGVQTDVYGLGVVLYEMLAGHPPFVGRTDSETLHKIQSQELSPAALRARYVPRDLATICYKCLEKKQADRYQSAGQLADDLRSFLNGEVVAARPVGVGERFVRWCRRRPVIAALSVGMAVSLVTGALVASWQWARAERHLASALAEAERAEKNLEQAEDTLLDFAWLVEESTLWDTRNKSVLDALHAKLDEYHKAVAAQHEATGQPAPLMAAVFSFAARNAAASNDPGSADGDYRRSLDLWRAVVEQRPDHAGYRRAYSLCLLNYCRFLLDSPRPADGEDPLARPRADLRATGAEDPYGRQTLIDFTQLVLEYGDALDGATRFNDSLAVFQLGLIAAEELHAHLPNEPRWQFLIGNFCRLIGVHHERLRRGDLALEALNRAQDSLRPAIDAAPREWRYRRELALAQRAVAGIYRDRGAMTDAALPLDSALDLLTNLCHERPDDAALHVELAVTLRLLAITQNAQGHPSEALHTMTQCRAAWRTARRLDPTMPESQLKLVGHACYDEGEMAMTLGRHDAARDALIEGAEIFASVSQSGRMNTADDLDWAGCHVFLGFQQAAAEQLQPAIDSYTTAIRILEPRVGRTNPDKRLVDLHRRSVKRVEELRDRLAAADGQTEN